MPRSIPLRIAVAFVLTAAVLALGALLFPADGAVWSRARALIPTVLLLTLVMERVADLDEEEGGLLVRMTGHLRHLWDSGATGFYGAVAAATFVLLEIETFREEWSAAGSIREWIRGEAFESVMGFSVDSIMNLVQASIWFVAWMDALEVGEMGILAGACFGAYALGRWAWPDRDRVDPIENALERLGRS